MNPRLVGIAFRPAIRRAARAALIGRSRKRHSLGVGRFTRADVNEVLKETWGVYDRLSPEVPREAKVGSQMNVLLSCLTVACLEVLMARGTEREYAIELIGDVAWKVYERWGRIPIALARLRTPNPRDRMRLSVNMFLRFPFSPPGYRFERLPSDEGIALDMIRCPVAEYMRGQSASDLCVGTWCNLDFALAEMWGGWLERSDTLAAGCRSCNFHFKANTRNSDKRSAGGATPNPSLQPTGYGVPPPPAAELKR